MNFATCPIIGVETKECGHFQLLKGKKEETQVRIIEKNNE